MSAVYNGVSSPKIHRGLWQSWHVIAWVTKFSEVKDLDHFQVANMIGPAVDRAQLLLASGFSKPFSQLYSDWVI